MLLIILRLYPVITILGAFFAIYVVNLGVHVYTIAIVLSVCCITSGNTPLLLLFFAALVLTTTWIKVIHKNWLKRTWMFGGYSLSMGSGAKPEVQPTNLVGDWGPFKSLNQRISIERPIEEGGEKTYAE